MKKHSSLIYLIKNHKTTITVITLIFGAKFLGFIKNVVLAKYYGTSAISDAYQMAISIPTITTGVLLYSHQAFTKGYFISKNNKDADKYTSSFVTFILLATAILCLATLVFKKHIIELFAPGFDEEKIWLVESLMTPIAVGVAMQVIANVLMEYLRANKSFIAPQASFLLVNIVETATIALAFWFNIQWLAYGYLLANFIFLAIITLLCYKKGFRYSFMLNKKHILLFKKILIPVLLSSIIVEVNAAIDKAFASNFETGVVSAISYSTNIRSVLLIIAAGILTVLFPKISKLSAEKQIENLRNTVKKAAKVIFAIYVPMTAMSILFAESVVKIVYLRGEFNDDSLISTTNCLVMYSFGLLGICIRDLLVKALYSLEKGKTIICISVMSVTLNIILNIIITKIIGYSGLPLATSISATVSVLPLYYQYRKAVLTSKI